MVDGCPDIHLVDTVHCLVLLGFPSFWVSSQMMTSATLEMHP